MIKLSNIQKSYKLGKNSLHVLKGINLEIKEGEMVAIMGSSGSGKSTLLNILGILDSQEIKNLDETKAANYRNKFLGFVFQSFNLISYKTAIQNVALPLQFQKINRKSRQKRAKEFLGMVGLAEWSTHHPNELSGGQKQRVAIARALVTQPRVLLADEPTGALDSKTSYELMELLQKINDSGETIIIVTHEEDIASMCKRIVNLKDGKIVEDKHIKQKLASEYV
jgi:putative ABC transport system ATP-binding protein